jgi:hypothetical protein
MAPTATAATRERGDQGAVVAANDLDVFCSVRMRNSIGDPGHALCQAGHHV